MSCEGCSDEVCVVITVMKEQGLWWLSDLSTSHRVTCKGDYVVGMVVGCLLQHSRGLVLNASDSSPR